MNRMRSELFRGSINPMLTVSYSYMYDPPGSEYPTLRRGRDGETLVLKQGFGLSISEGFEKAFIYIPGKLWYTFTALLEKSVKKISDNLYNIFPSLNKTDMDPVSSRTLQRFQTEEAMSSGGMTVMPDTWVNESGETFPAIKITSTKYPEGIKIPFEDAIPISKMLNNMDPQMYGFWMLDIITSFK